MHHAQLLEGTYEWALTMLPEMYRVESADSFHYRGARMGVDEARMIIEESHFTPLVNDERVFVIAYLEFTHEAQNALLKLLEEPPKTSRFYVVTSQSGKLLPTLRSRLVSVGTEEIALHTEVLENFLRLSYAERLSAIGERIKKKDDVWVVSLMEAFEVWAHEHTDVAFMQALLDLKSFFGTPGASKKMILEHLALMLPIK